jgi:hypothetical protein
MTSDPNPMFLILPSFDATQFMHLLQCQTNQTPQKMFPAIFLNIIIYSFNFNNNRVKKKCFNSYVTAYVKYTLKFPCCETLMITMFSLQCFSKPRPVCCLCVQQVSEMLGNSCLQHNNVPAHIFLFVQQFWHMTTVLTLHKPERHLCGPPYFQKSRLHSKGKDTLS